MAYTEDASLRIAVSGIKNVPVRRNEKGMGVEDDLSCFFHDNGCKVAGVRLVLDPRRHDVSRGFGFVDFEDYESLDLALKLHNKEAKGLVGKDGKLRIEKARSVMEEGNERTQEVPDASKQGEEMRREPVRVVKRKHERQNVVETHELQLQEEKRRQAAIRQAMETITDAEQRIHTAIGVQDERTSAMEAIVISIDSEQTQRHQDEASVCKKSSATSPFCPRDDSGPPAVNSSPTQHNGGDSQGGSNSSGLPLVDIAKCAKRETRGFIWVYL